MENPAAYFASRVLEILAIFRINEIEQFRKELRSTMHRFREQPRVSLLLSIESTTETRTSGKIPRELPLTAKRDEKGARNVPREPRQGKSLARHSRTTALKPMHLPIEIPFEFIPPSPHQRGKEYYVAHNRLRER